MGRGTWYYSLGVFLAIVDAFVRSEFEISSWHGARVDVRTYLLGGAIDGSKANGIIRNPKLELESSRFTFDLVPLSYGGVLDVIRSWRKRTKEDTRSRRSTKEDELRLCDIFVRKLSRCGRNQMGNEQILALPEGADDFVVYYDVRSNDLEACLEKGRRLTNRWLSMKKDIASCGSKYLAYLEVEVEYHVPTAKGVGLRMANSYSRNHPKDGFAPLKTIRRLLVAIGRRSYSGFEGDNFEPERRASNDFATATFSWLDEFVADAAAPIEALLSKKPPVLQKPAPLRT
ncbi:hypothetical protein Tco_0990312 [Tanacetum coccineum]|uniref:Uncharacterized protein n=1 Tax=Tanacetum coccineum TaxID=301880 RepID=A0ABQ5EW42_9ASTR